MVMLVIWSLGVNKCLSVFEYSLMNWEGLQFEGDFIVPSILGFLHASMLFGVILGHN